MEEFKCPCCDGAIAFDAVSQNLKCPYCGTEFDVETLSGYNNDVSNDGTDSMEWEEAETQEWTEGDSEGLRVYVCKSCGGEIVADEQQAATSCPYCDNPVVFNGQLSGVLKPDLVVPFKLDKKMAIETLKKHYEGKILLPKAFKTQNHLEEIKGIYVPFWIYDTDTDAHMRYRATRTRFWSDSRYNYTETSYYSVTRGGTLGFKDVPVDGSSKIDNVMMESLEPFNLSAAVDFETAYLAGYLADKYDVDSETCSGRANQRIKRSTEEEFRKTVVGYNTVSEVSSGVQFRNGRSRYALLPIWLLTTKWNGNTYHFAINGQTGKLAGDLPMDKSIFTKWFIGLTAGVGVISYLVSYLLWLI